MIVVVPDKDDYAFAKPTNLALPFHLKTEVTKSKWRIKESYHRHRYRADQFGRPDRLMLRVADRFQ